MPAFGGIGGGCVVIRISDAPLDVVRESRRTMQRHCSHVKTEPRQMSGESAPHLARPEYDVEFAISH